MPKIACMKGTSFHMNNMWIKQLCNHKVWDFAAAFRERNASGPSRKELQDIYLAEQTFLYSTNVIEQLCWHND